MLTIVLGAPGSGKSTVATRVRTVLTGHAVVDWDDFMPAVEALTGRDVRNSPELWAPYRELVRAVVAGLGAVPTVLFTVCTPDELAGWPAARWVLLDCEDEERRHRLRRRPDRGLDDAIVDADRYRRLGLPALDTSARTADDVAAELAKLITSR